MRVIVLTPEEFLELKRELINEVTDTLKQGPALNTSKWLRTPDVCKLLNLSNSSIQNLRNNGLLKYSKINGTILYKSSDIEELLKSNLKNVTE